MFRCAWTHRVLLVAAVLLSLAGTIAAAQAPVRVAATYPLGMLLPDSELLLGPTLYNWDASSYVASEGGYMARYSEAVDGEVLSGAQVVDRVAGEYSVGPRLLLALVDMHSGWVRNPEPAERYFPVGEPLPGLRTGLAQAAASLNRFFYAHLYDGLRTITLKDGTTIEVPASNAATFALLAYLSREATVESWAGLEAPSRFYAAWAGLFGDPYQYLSTEVLPHPLPEVELRLPFTAGEMWYYVAGPHNAAGPGTPRAAIDFAPPPEGATGCHLALAYVTAAAPGVVARSRGGEVVVDLDGDGFEGSGWTHHYRHLSSFERIEEGKRVKAGDPLGHPSCEGGETTLTRLTFARRFNGAWIPVDYPEAPLIMDGWAALPGPGPGSGWLARSGIEPREASLTKSLSVNGVVALPGGL